MDSTQARSRLADAHPHVGRSDDGRDIESLHALARWATRFAPLVAPDTDQLPGDRGLILDVTGCERLYKGERSLLHTVQEHLARFQINASGAIASTLGGAWAAARFAPAHHAIIASGEESDVLNPLPIDALRLEPAVLSDMRELSIETIEQLRAISRTSIAQRFHPDVVQRLDQALGRHSETINPIRLTEPPQLTRIFNGPVTRLEGIERATRELIRQLCDILRALDQGVVRLELRFERCHLHDANESIRFSRPSHIEKHIWTRLAPRIERLHLGDGIESIDITATRIGQLRHQQHQLNGDSGAGAVSKQRRQPTDVRTAIKHSRELGETIDILRDRLGDNAVTTPHLAEQHLPEHAATTQPIHRKPPVAYQQTDAHDLLVQRPTTLLSPPEPITPMTTTPGGMLHSFRWRNHTHHVQSVSGPERIMQPWWASGSLSQSSTDMAGHASGGGLDTYTPAHMKAASAHEARDYFIIVTEQGHWLWIYRTPTTTIWHVHGMWC